MTEKNDWPLADFSVQVLGAEDLHLELYGTVLCNVNKAESQVSYSEGTQHLRFLPLKMDFLLVYRVRRCKKASLTLPTSVGAGCSPTEQGRLSGNWNRAKRRTSSEPWNKWLRLLISFFLTMWVVWKGFHLKLLSLYSFLYSLWVFFFLLTSELLPIIDLQFIRFKIVVVELWCCEL